MIYDKPTRLSVKLTSSTMRLSRRELFTRLQLVRFIDPVIDEVWKQVEKKRHEEQAGDSPHGNPWHVSFHASQFPGDSPLACPRAALYQMADFADPDPFSRSARMVMSAGKAIEEELVRALHEGGILLSAPPDAKVQTGFKVEDSWLTGSVDCVIKHPKKNKPIPIEIKSKYADVISAMKLGKKGPDDAHVSQLKTQIGLIRRAQTRGELWSDMDLVTHGYLLYNSRDKPSDTAEFRVDYDSKFFEAGLQKLKQFKALWMEESLSQQGASKRHPLGWRWSYQPCVWCSHKTTCQADFKQNISDLSQSTGIRRTEKIRPGYNYQEARQRVMKRWDKQSAQAA